MTEPPDKNFSPQESLQLIQSMIAKTKEDISKNSFNFLLWGWLAFLAILGQYLLKVIFEYEHHYIVWLVTFIGLGISIVYNRRKNRGHARTYIGESMAYLWTGLGVSFFILSYLLANIKGGWFFLLSFFHFIIWTRNVCLRHDLKIPAAYYWRHHQLDTGDVCSKI